MKLNKIIIAIILLIPTLTLAKKDICFSEKEVKKIDERLEKDKKLINWYSNRWQNIINTIPTITYEIKDGKVIIQTVEFPIKNDKPLKYKIESTITIKKKEELSYFPLRFELCGIIESGAKNYIDAKIGLEFFSLSPLRIFILERFSCNFMVGVQSLGMTLSYQISKKYLKNTRIHFYTGFAYTVKPSFGGGISLFF